MDMLEVSVENCETQHGDAGFGVRNTEGTTILECCLAMNIGSGEYTV